MKKLIPLILISTLSISATAMADTMYEGGFNDGSFVYSQNKAYSALSTVEQVKTLSNKSWVSLKGNIIKQIDKDKYIFKDATGEIRVEIDRKRWGGQIITPNDLVEITGQMNKHRDYIKVNVIGIRLLTSKNTTQ